MGVGGRVSSRAATRLVFSVTFTCLNTSPLRLLELNAAWSVKKRSIHATVHDADLRIKLCGFFVVGELLHFGTYTIPSDAMDGSGTCSARYITYPVFIE